MNIINKKNFYNLSEETILKILNNIYNQVYVTDKNFKILYMNNNNNYKIETFLSKENYYSLSSIILDEKRRICMEQAIDDNEKVIITSTPIFDENKKIKMIVSIIQERLKNLDLTIKTDLKKDFTFDYSKYNCKIITRSEKMKSILNTVKKISFSNAPVLIQGNSGTGKTLLAKYIHNNSLRKDEPFFSINCATIPENLLESELFGYSPYAFTGANPKGKIGLISLANKGTLFLDEIGELSPALQAKLLGVVENHQFIPIGGKKIENVDIRIIAATNRNLEEMITEKTFREDLFWRLSVIELIIPALTDRKEDIVPLANYYLNIFNTKHNKNKFFSEEVIDIFLHYHWPGNIRQLRNIIERAVILNKDSKITLTDIPNGLLFSSTSEVNKEKIENLNFDSEIENYERKYIKKLFTKYKTSREMAKILDISQTKANKLINKYIHNKID